MPASTRRPSLPSALLPADPKQRQELPWVPVEKEYAFDTEEGKKTLAELFDGRSQLGWKFPWVSSFGSDFNFDFDFAFASEDGVVYQTYARTAPDRFLLAPYYYQLLDQIPNGRDADFPLRRHDEY